MTRRGKGCVLSGSMYSSVDLTRCLSFWHLQSHFLRPKFDFWAFFFLGNVVGVWELGHCMCHTQFPTFCKKKNLLFFTRAWPSQSPDQGPDQGLTQNQKFDFRAFFRGCGGVGSRPVYVVCTTHSFPHFAKKEQNPTNNASVNLVISCNKVFFPTVLKPALAF